MIYYITGRKNGTVSSKMSTKLLVFVLLISINFVHCVLFEEELTDEARKKKDKYLYPVILGGLIVKAIIFPLAFKFMAVMSSVAVMLSIMSLIVSSIVGYVKVAIKPNHPAVKVIHLNDWSKDDYGYDMDWPFQSDPVYSSRRVKY